MDNWKKTRGGGKWTPFLSETLNQKEMLEILKVILTREFHHWRWFYIADIQILQS